MTKVISLSDEAYHGLKSLKREDESFSDVVVRLASEKKNEALLNLAGKLQGTKEEWDRIEKQLKEDRRKFKLRMVEL